MKRKDLACFFALLLSLVLVFNLQAREVKDYNVTSKQSPSGLVIKFQINNYEIDDVIKDGQSYSTIRFDSGTHTGKKGWAELPFIHTSVALPDNRNVTVQVVDMQYEEIDLTYPLLPSRGTIYRNQDPSTIPYETDPASMVDAWYPVDMLSVTDPYIIRDVRGENIYVYPFMYNAVQKKLRIYTHVSLKVEENNTPPVNPILNPSDKIAREMSSVYSSLFINYDSYSTKWTNEVGEYGEILVIYTSRDATVIQPWITWKKEMGYKVHELQVSTGTNVKTNIQTQYTANTNILYVLLVGDWADIKSDLGTTQNAPMDPMLGCVVGGDNYHDIIIGRFSASTTTHVTTQGNKVITYERDPDAAGTWYSVGLGIGGNDGPGDDSEYDYQQVDVIKDYKLLPFTWNTVNEAYGNPTATTVANYVNAGLSVINYCGHGAHDYWVTSSYSVTNVNSSTNGNKLPIVFSVACVVGEFHNGGDCLAEAMLRKSGGGAAATWMATINQPWNPPMRGQDYANDVLTQGYNYSTGAGNGTSTTYGKTTFGSITFNAAALMIAESSATDDWDTYKTWTVFGDPSLQVRTETPHTLSLSNPTVTPGTYTTQVTVGGSPFQNALVSLYKTGDPQPYSGLTDVSGNVTITHPLTGTIKLTVTGFNLYTYQQSVTVTSPNPPVANFVADQTTVTAGSTVNFTDLTTNAPTSWSWTFTGGTPNSSTTQNPSIVYNTPGVYSVSLTATNAVSSDTETKNAYITVNAVTNPPVADFVASSTSISVGQSVNFTDLSTNQPTSWSWTFTGGTPGTSTAQNPTNITYSAQGTYAVSLTATNAYGSDNETKTAYITVGPDPGFSLDFEDCANYSADFNPWSVYDGDGQATYGSSDCDFPGESDTMSFMAFNPSDAGFTLSSAHGGVRCGMSICPGDASESDDWLISEQLTLGNTSSISFWVRSPKPGSWGNDSYEVLVSTTNNNPASFTVISGASPVEAPSTWTQHTYSLASYDNQTVYVAVRHVATDKFMFFIDDILINTTFAALNPPVAGFTASATTICAGSSVTFTNTTTGATSYSWSFPGGSPSSSTATNPTVTYSTAGTYTVTLTATNTDGSDAESLSVTVIQVAASANVTNETTLGANDGQIDLTPSGGNAPYTYNWSNAQTTQDLTNLAPGTYNVTVTDANGCTGTGSWTVTQGSSGTPPVAGFTPSATTICVGQSVTFTNTTTGATGYSWSFPGGSPSSSTSASPTVTYTTAGSYTATLTATNTDGSDVESVTINVIDVTVSAISSDESVMGANDGSIDLTPSGGNAPYTYYWSNSATTEDISGLAPGTYNVTVTDANGCTETGSWTILQGPQGIEQPANGMFSLYPNPTTGDVTLQFSSTAIRNIEVYNILGKKMMSLNSNENRQNIDLAGFSKGVYIIQVREKERIITGRVVLK